MAAALEAGSEELDGSEWRPPAGWRLAALAAGPLVGAAAAWVVHGHGAGGGGSNAGLLHHTLPWDGAVTLGLMAWMAVWWLGQAVPLAVTALLPLAVLPLMRICAFRDAAAPYADGIIFLFAGGCVLAAGLRVHGLDRLLANLLLAWSGRSAMGAAAALFAASTLISAFVSNTATAAMMLPLAIAVAAHVRRHAVRAPDGSPPARAGNVAPCFLLAVAYGASIGGTLTPVGSPPNAIALRELERATGEAVGFGFWGGFSLPVVAVFAPLAWWLLARFLVPVHGVRTAIHGPAPDAGSGPSSGSGRGERAAMLLIFAFAAAGWFGMPWWRRWVPALDDSLVAVVAAIAALALPLGRGGRALVPWRDADLPWGVLVLFGGGLSLAQAVQEHGVGEWIGAWIGELGVHGYGVLLVAVVTTCVFLTEIASNTALVATLAPVMVAIAERLGIPPAALLLPVAFSASWAFMLPVGTPPNALVFATGRVGAGRMARTGLVLNLLAITVIVAAARLRW